MQGSRRITHPTDIETHVEVALRAPSRFAVFDDLVTLAVRAADCDERYGPFLPKRDDEDEAQCDSNLSLSPLLKHYPHLFRTVLRGYKPREIERVVIFQCLDVVDVITLFCGGYDH